MIRVNLLPPEFKRQERKVFNLLDFVNAKGLFFLLLVLVAIEAALFAYRSTITTPKHEELKKRFSSLSPSLKAVRTIKAQASSIQETKRGIEGRMTRPFSWTQTLNAVSDEMIPGLWLTQIYVQRYEFEIKEEDKPAAKPDAKSDAAKQKGAKATGPTSEKRAVMVIEGKVTADAEETAMAGLFIKKLKNNPVISELMSDVYLNSISKEQATEEKIFNIVIYAVFTKEIDKDMFDL